MIEPEVAFIDLPQLQILIESFIKYISKYIKDNCVEEIKFFANDKPFLYERLDTLINNPFTHVDYKDAIVILEKAVKDGHQFEDNNIFFGKDLASEHERYLCEKVYNGPMFLQNFPKEIKSFYMKANPDNITVAACDLLVPGVGEIVGGSQREDDYDKLMNKVKELGINIESIQ
jgi:asparaginyl-tRNA synthetase